VIDLDELEHNLRTRAGVIDIDATVAAIRELRAAREVVAASVPAIEELSRYIDDCDGFDSPEQMESLRATCEILRERKAAYDAATR
jgi:hypothetical protein